MFMGETQNVYESSRLYGETWLPQVKMIQMHLKVGTRVV